MCAACVAQGITYVGGAVGALQVAAFRARRRRIAAETVGVPTPTDTEVPPDDQTHGRPASSGAVLA